MRGKSLQQSDWWERRIANEAKLFRLKRYKVPNECQDVAWLRATNSGGGGLRGYVATDYSTICSTFGAPNFHSIDLIVEWEILFGDGTAARIYVYKLWPVPRHLYLWHVGGLKHKGVELIAGALHTDYFMRESDHRRRDEIDNKPEIPF